MCVPLCRETDARPVNLLWFIPDSEDFREGIIADNVQFPAEALGEAGGLGVVEPGEDAVAEEPSGTKERLVDVVGAAVDRADDLEAEEIGEHPVGEVEDGADLVAIVRPAAREGGVGILQNDDELAFGMVAPLVRPEADEFGVGKDVHGRGRNEIEPMRVLQHSHKVSQIGGLSGSGRSFKDRKAVIACADFGGEILMPLAASIAVVEGECFFAEEGLGSKRDSFNANLLARGDEIKRAASRGGRLVVGVIEPGHQALGSLRGFGIANDPGIVGVEKGPWAKLKGEVVPFFKAFIGKMPADGSEERMGILRDRAFEIP